MSYYVILLVSCIISSPQLFAHITQSHDLLNSTHIVRHLIKKNKVKKLLEDTDSEQLEILLNNFSPAEIAFESEVLSAQVPVILYFYNPTDKNHNQLQALVENIATHYKDTIKVVIIDAQALYKIAEKAEIEELPTIMIVRDRQEIERLIQPITEQRLKEMVDNIF